MNKVLIVFTGGTIAMTIDETLGAAVPGLDGNAILSMIKGIDQYGEIEIIDFGQFPGPQMHPGRILELAKLLKRSLERDDIQGAIITHGTDTLEETAYFLDLYLTTHKPVVVVGAMRNASELGFDGPANLAAAIVAVKSPQSFNRGVLVVLNNQVNSAREVTKTHTMTLDTFKSLEFGPLGIVDNNEVLFSRQVIPHSHLVPDDIEPAVHLLKSYVGMDRFLIDQLVAHGTKGIVIEAMGRGNLPPELVPAIQQAVDQGVAVVVVSRCPSGRVLGSYGYQGGGQQLRDSGAMFGTAMNGQKTRIKLMLALKVARNQSELRAIMENENFDVASE